MQFSVEDDLVPQMRACATHAFTAVLNKLNPMRRQHCFELFGLDFMVDARHKVCCILEMDLTVMKGADASASSKQQKSNAGGCMEPLLLGHCMVLSAQSCIGNSGHKYRQAEATACTYSSSNASTSVQFYNRSIWLFTTQVSRF